jgi:hypothetical protein
MKASYKYVKDGVKYQLVCIHNGNWYRRELHPVFGPSVFQSVMPPTIIGGCLKQDNKMILLTKLANEPLNLPKN